jgi:hypothetical protein
VADTAEKIIVPIIVAVLGTSVVNIFVSAFLRPEIFTEVIPDAENPLNATINVINKGRAPAKNLQITVEAPYNITNHRIFSTENYTQKFIQNSTTLEVLLPRFSQGDGSLVKINTLAN